MRDRLARGLAASALGVALLALVLAAYSVSLGLQYLDDVRVLGQAMSQSREDAPLMAPPVQLDTD